VFDYPTFTQAYLVAAVEVMNEMRTLAAALAILN
jgi:hypothetical protein